MRDVLFPKGERPISRCGADQPFARERLPPARIEPAQ
jgi:hypothetical protein